jgi:hypothetical protein
MHEEGYSSYALAFTRDSRYLVVAIADRGNHQCKLLVCDPKSFNILWKQEGFYAGQPAIFTSTDAVCVAAFDQLFTIRGPDAIDVRPLKYKPDALSTDNHTAFHSATPQSRYLSESGPSIFVKEGGIDITDLQSEHPSTFLRLADKPHYYCFPLRYFSSSPHSRGRLIGLLIDPDNNIEDHILIDLDTYNYARLPESGLWSISDDGHTFARCWKWGIGAWKLPE